MTAKFLRFVIVGGLSTVAYGITTSLLIESGLGPVPATALGYLFVIPMNFILQRSFTFRSKSEVKGDLLRFFLVHGGNIAASMGAMLLVTDVLNADYRLGIVLTMTVVPVAVFIMLDRWVFRPRTP